MARYRYDAKADTIIDKETGEPAPHVRDIASTGVPYVRGDLPAYYSVATGKWVDGRRARRDDLARSGCIPWEPDKHTPKGVASKKLAAKYGVKWSEEAAHRPRAKRIDPLAELRR